MFLIFVFAIGDDQNTKFNSFKYFSPFKYSVHLNIILYYHNLFCDVCHDLNFFRDKI